MNPHPVTSRSMPILLGATLPIINYYTWGRLPCSRINYDTVLHDPLHNKEAGVKGAKKEPEKCTTCLPHIPFLNRAASEL